MKLKKIVSLALAGILAVSMLAGCSNGANNNSENTTDQPVVDNSIVGILNTATSGNKAGISFTSDADFNKLVADVVAQKGTDSADPIKNALATEMKITNNKNFNTNDLNPNTISGSGNSEEREAVVVYVVSGKNMTALTAAYQKVNEIAANVNGLKDLGAATTGNDAYKYSYSEAYASMVQVSSGETNYYVIALHVTCETEKV